MKEFIFNSKYSIGKKRKKIMKGDKGDYKKLTSMCINSYKEKDQECHLFLQWHLNTNLT